MISSIQSLVTVAAVGETIDIVIRRMAKESRDVKNPGIAVILDKKGILLGIVTDGDIRRSYSDDILFSNSVSQIMVSNPITISEKTPDKDIALEVIRQVQLNENHHSEWVRHVLVVNDKNQLIDVIDYLKILQDRTGSVKRVAVFGMGYVGITLAVSLANRGHQVTGIDIQENIVALLNSGKSHVFEPGLPEMLSSNLERDSLSFDTVLKDNANQVYIVAVGTPLNHNSQPDLASLTQVLKVISKVLKVGDQIMLRSTVPVGVTREVVIPYFEKAINLVAGKDFFVTFAPERTIEGKAMYELKTLPQVIGGYSEKCLNQSAGFWSTLTSTVIRSESLEAAEMVKLANNTFRDLSFAFANELAMIADDYNVDAFELIKSANEGYPRNIIPLPSPGVGGYCLTKDPILFSCNSKGLRPDAVLGLSSRKINERAALYPVKIIQKYAKNIEVNLKEVNVLILGIAFKGLPETKDLRGSVAIDALNALKGMVGKISGWDAIVKSEDISKAGFNTVDDLDDAINQSDVVLLLNNHPSNVPPSIYNATKQNKKRLIFDGWHQLDKVEIEKTNGLTYSTMGYTSQ
jgi:UDP-N-acetyl-D-mannosaminuronic acid dehydrogenase